MKHCKNRKSDTEQLSWQLDPPEIFHNNSTLNLKTCKLPKSNKMTFAANTSKLEHITSRESDVNINSIRFSDKQGGPTDLMFSMNASAPENYV